MGDFLKAVQALTWFVKLLAALAPQLEELHGIITRPQPPKES